MTDETQAAGVDAPAEQTTAPETAVPTPNPAEQTIPTRADAEAEANNGDDKAEHKAEEKPKRSVSDALKAAEEKVKAEAEKAAGKKDTEKKPETAESGKETGEKPDDGPTRGPDGKFTSQKADEKPQEAPEAEKHPQSDSQAPKAETAHREAPKRFDDAAKKDWESAPESVRGAIHRTVRELESGIQKYQEAMEPLRPYHDLAQKAGTSIPEALERYTNLERTLQSDPLKGLQAVADYAGVDLRKVAAHIMGQSPEEVDTQRDQTIRELRGEIAGLKEQFGQVSTSVQEQNNVATLRQVEAFAAEHPRFDELSETIAAEIKAGHSLEDAYRRAELLNPVSTPTAQTREPETIQDDAEVQTLKGSKSVSGAPRGGTSPKQSRPGSSSIREALERAAARAG